MGTLVWLRERAAHLLLRSPCWWIAHHLVPAGGSGAADHWPLFAAGADLCFWRIVSSCGVRSRGLHRSYSKKCSGVLNEMTSISFSAGAVVGYIVADMKVLPFMLGLACASLFFRCWPAVPGMIAEKVLALPCFAETAPAPPPLPLPPPPVALITTAVAPLPGTGAIKRSIAPMEDRIPCGVSA